MVAVSYAEVIPRLIRLVIEEAVAVDLILIGVFVNIYASTFAARVISDRVPLNAVVVGTKYPYPLSVVLNRVIRNLVLPLVSQKNTDEVVVNPIA